MLPVTGDALHVHCAGAQDRDAPSSIPACAPSSIVSSRSTQHVSCCCREQGQAKQCPPAGAPSYMLTAASDASQVLLLLCRLRTLQTAPQPSPLQRPPDLPRPPSAKRTGGQGSAALGSAGGGSVGSASAQDLRRVPSTRLGLGSRTASRRHSASFSQVNCLVDALAARQRCAGPHKACVPASECFGPGRTQKSVCEQVKSCW